MSEPQYDVAIVGSGPGASVAGALLRKYSDARVVIIQPRSPTQDRGAHSQLPTVGPILQELGCWDAVERAGFPIMVGATLRWGHSLQLWNFDFVANGNLRPQARPAPFEGQRQQTGLLVERPIYDDILLRHAQDLGCEVRAHVQVASVERDGNTITRLHLDDDRTVSARWYVDASGDAACLRNAMEVGVSHPSSLHTTCIWQYWDNAQWAETIGTDGTRAQIISVERGWLWYMPVSGTRASVGLVVPHSAPPSDPSTLYSDAIAQEPRIADLLQGARPHGSIHAADTPPYLADHAYGDNWFLVGEALGASDPIVASDLALTHGAARELAYTLGSLLRGEHEAAWLKRHYEENQRARVSQHIRFAAMWYAGNQQLSARKAQTQAMAERLRLPCNADDAWQWLAQGGLAKDILGQGMIGGYDLGSAKQVLQRLFGQKPTWHLSMVNTVRLVLDNAELQYVPYYHQGKVVPIRSFFCDGRRLTMVGPVGLAAKLMATHSHTPTLLDAYAHDFTKLMGGRGDADAAYHGVQAIELLISEGWVEGVADPSQPFVSISTPDEGVGVHTYREAGSHDPLR